MSSVSLVKGVPKTDGTPSKLTLDTNGLPFTTLGYANGPGYRGGARPDLSSVDTTALNFLQEAVVPLSSETHGGEDVGIWAIGPWAHLYQGTVDENYTFMVMDKALAATERLAAKK